MSLQIHMRDRDGRLIEIPPSSQGGAPRLFGIESFRYELWGSEAIERLGCQLLPSLKRGSIDVNSREAAHKLKRECEVLFERIDEVCDSLSYPKEDLEFYLNNLLHVLNLMEQRPGSTFSIG